MPFAAIVTELTDKTLKELYGNNSFLLEAWADGKLLFQRAFKEEIRVLNSSRKDNSIIYVPAKVDEPDRQRGDFIYIVSLGENLDDIQDRKVPFKECKVHDWTGLCINNKLEGMHCMIDKKDVLYLSVENKIHAIKLQRDRSQVLTEGSNSIKGSVDLTKAGLTNFRCLCL